MYNETKKAVRKAFIIGKILFSMDKDKYNLLIELVKKIYPPTINELEDYLKDGVILEDAIVLELKKRYTTKAIENGFTEKQGLAILEYSAMLEDLYEDDKE